MKARLLFGILIVFCLASVTVSASEYFVEFEEADEDYVDFGSMSGFMSGSSWSIIEKVKIPQGADNPGGWHMFRGKAWEDETGDIAIKLRDGDKTPNLRVWLWKGGWNHLDMNNGSHNIYVTKNTWYTICVVYDSTANEYKLYVNGIEVDSDTTIGPMDDSGNTNKLFFGGQDSDYEYRYGNYIGDIYSEADMTIAHQAWFQRVLSPTEISDYNGWVNPDSPALFFSTEITSTDITDASGNGHDGINGNTPYYGKYTSEEEIPEFPTVAIPVIGMLAILAIMNRRR